MIILQKTDAMVECLEQCFSTAGPRTGACPRLLSCRSAKYISILYLNWKMLKADSLFNTCGRQAKSVWSDAYYARTIIFFQ